MNYEKRYNELIEAIKEMLEANPHDEGLQNWVHDNVPELTESEDEKVRKSLIELFKDMEWDDSILHDYGMDKNKTLAWLEKQETSYTKKDVDDAYLKGISDAKNEFKKQYEANYQIRKDIATFIFNYSGDIKDRAKWMDYLGVKVYVFEKEDEKPQGKSALQAAKEEKVDNQNCMKPVDKVEPKFHEGDWVVFIASRSVCQVEKKEKYYYTLRHILGDSMPLSFGSEHLIRLWTIEDAKEGDVLYYKGDNNIEYIVMNKGINMQGNIDSYFRYNSLDGFAVDVPGVLSAKNDNITPATEEQCDLLFSKMKEAGYEWDGEKKELKEIES